MDSKNVIAAIALSSAVIVLYSLFFIPEQNLKNQNLEEREKIEQNTDTPSLEQKENLVKISRDEASNLNYQNYYNTYVPYYNKASNQANLHGSRDELMKKLNYMIHLLEENKDEKTQNVTEELVLYMFLGVFTIFVVDSFARAGKYTR